MLALRPLSVALGRLKEGAMGEARRSGVRIRDFAWPFEPLAYDESARVHPYGNVLVGRGGGPS